jgi:hypothetical protein
MKNDILEEGTVIASGFVESAFDSLLKDGFLRDVPIIGTLCSAVKIGIDFRDRILISKLKTLIVDLDLMSTENIEKFKRKITIISQVMFCIN